MKKSLIFVLIAVLSAGLLFVGCGQGTDGGTSYVNIGGRLVDVEVSTEALLLDALENPDYTVIGVTGNPFTYTSPTALTVVTEIPAGKTVVLYTSITPAVVADGGLEVKGELIVEGAGTLAATVDNPVRVTDGLLEVNNGTLDLDSVVAIHGSNIEVQILGTSKAHFNGGTLDIANPVATLEDITTAFSWVPKGTLIIAGVTQPVKPSELALLPATATRRLTVTATLPVDPNSPDTAETITVPAGMTFTSADLLTNLKTLSVAGDLTLSDATLSKIENLTVTGELDATSATYARVKTLTVGSTLTITQPLNLLESLSVNAGVFTAANATGSAEEGLTIAVAAGAAATMGSITKLKTSTIQGALTAPGFVPDTGAVLTAAAGAAINGITFPADAVITALGTAAVTIDNYTVPEEETLAIGTSTLTIPTGKILTLEADAVVSGSTGTIVALGDTAGGSITIDGTAGYLTEAGGVTGTNFMDALAALKAAVVTLTNSIDLRATYFAGGNESQYLGIGSVTVTSNSAGVAVVNTGTGSGGSALDIGDTTFVGAIGTITQSGTNTGLTGTIAVSLDSGAIKVADDGWVVTTPKYVILTVPAGLKLENNDLLSPVELPAFSIGLTTARTS
jgi:hypothetical protein